MRALVVVGVRPQYIKAIALARMIAASGGCKQGTIEMIFADTGQHYDHGLTPFEVTEQNLDFSVRFEHETKDAFAIFSESIGQLGKYVRSLEARPDCAIVIGDANPTLVGAIVAAKCNLPIVHIEAGAKRDAFEQEEINRRVADSLATLRFCFSQQCEANLRAEGCGEGTLWTGDLWRPYLLSLLDSLGPEPPPKLRTDILLTIHRPQNSEDDVLHDIALSFARSNRRVLWITHPRTETRVRRICMGISNIAVDSARSHSEMVRLLWTCAYVCTDSGGLIREAHHLRRHTLVRRDHGGWGELIALGVNYRIGTTPDSIGAGMLWVEDRLRRPYPAESPLVRCGGDRIAISAICGLREHHE